MIEIGTDGCCKGNPGPGGWGVVVFEDGVERYRFKEGCKNTTNNREELKAFICALEFIDESGCQPDVLWADSQYVIKGAQEWLRGWILRDWKTSTKKPVENRDLWEKVADLRSVWRDLNIEWSKGHSGHGVNEAADQAANEGYEEAVLGDEW